MTKISIENIKILREQTGAGFNDCKLAMDKANNNIEKAIEFLRKNNTIKAEKRSERVTQHGRIFSKADKLQCILIEVLCETDFTARNIKFINIMESIIDDIFNNNQNNEDIFEYINTNLKEKLILISTKTGENIKIRRAIQWFGNCASYIHLNGNIGTIIKYDYDLSDIRPSDEMLKDICMHITAFEPKYISKQDIPSKEIESEKNIYMEQLQKQGKIKSQDILEKIINGKLEKWYDTICLMNQPWIKNDKVKVSQIIKNLKIKKFLRWKAGENI